MNTVSQTHSSPNRAREPRHAAPHQGPPTYGLSSHNSHSRSNRCANKSLPSIRGSRESSEITPLPSDKYFKTLIIQARGAQDLSNFDLCSSDRQSNMPSYMASDPLHSSPAHHGHQLASNKAPENQTNLDHKNDRLLHPTDIDAALESCIEQDSSDSHDHKLPHHVQKALTEMFKRKIQTEGAYTEEKLIQILTTIYYSNNTLDRRALVAFIEDMAAALVVKDPLRIIRARNLEHGLDIFEQDIASINSHMHPTKMSDASISKAADRLLLRTLNHRQPGPAENPSLPQIQGHKAQVAKKVLRPKHTAQPDPPHYVNGRQHSGRHDKNSSQAREGHSPQTRAHVSPTARVNNSISVRQTSPQIPVNRSASSEPTGDKTLKMSNLQLPFLQSTSSQPEPLSDSHMTLQEQFQRILEQQAIQQAQQQAQIQLLQQQLLIQQEIQQQQLIEQHADGGDRRGNNYMGYGNGPVRVEPISRYVNVPISSMDLRRPGGGTRAQLAGPVAVFGLPSQVAAPGASISRNRRPFSPEHIAATQQQQTVYECRSRAQELAGAFLGNRTASERQAREANLNWNQFSYKKELSGMPVQNMPPRERQSANKAVSPRKESSAQTARNNIPQISEHNLEIKDKAVQNTMVEEVATTPNLLSRLRPNRVSTPLLYREGITSIISCDNDTTNTSFIPMRSPRERLRSRLANQRNKCDSGEYDPDGNDIGLEVDSFMLDDMLENLNPVNLPSLNNRRMAREL